MDSLQDLLTFARERLRTENGPSANLGHNGTYRRALRRASYRRDPVPYTGKRRVPHYHGVRSGNLARDVYGPDFKRYGRPSRRNVFQKEICPYNSYYDTKYFSSFRTPKRDWKRTKVKRQFCRHSGHFGKPLKVLNEDFLEASPFDPRALEKELFDRSVIGPIDYLPFPTWSNFSPEDSSEYIPKAPTYVYLREDGDYEYECPHCGCLNMTDFNNCSTYYNAEYCSYCSRFIDLKNI